MMGELKIRYTMPYSLHSDRSYLSTLHHGQEIASVVPLADVDQLIGEAVWAMERVQEFSKNIHDGQMYDRAERVLASATVAQWRKRQEERKEMT